MPSITAKELNRRSLLQRSAALAAGLTLPAAALTPATAGRATAAQDKTVLRLQNWFSDADIDNWMIGIDMVKEMHPDIEVELEFVPYEETVTRTLVSATAGDLPDLIMASNEHTPTLSTQGILLDLNPFIEKDGDVNPEDFAAGVAQGFNMWGRWWGFPYDVTTFALYYNKDMFDAAGVDYPPSSGEPWTWDEFVEAAKALTKPNGEQWGVFMSGDFAWDQYRNSNFIYSAGGRNFDDQLRHSIIASPESAKGIQFAVDLIHTHKVTPTPAETAGGDVDYFASGLAAMKIDGQFALGQTSQTADFPFDIGYLPLGPVKRVVTGGSGFTVSATTQQTEAAWRWLKAFTSADVLGAMVGSTGRGIPARLSAADTYVKAAEGVEHAAVFVEQLDYAFNDRSVLGYPEFIDSYNRLMEPIFNSGEGSIEDALAQIQEQTNAVLDEQWADVKIDIETATPSS
jgi:multiple sugar transport system substrate-binding protein